MYTCQVVIDYLGEPLYTWSMQEKNIRIAFDEDELVFLRDIAKSHGYILSTSRLRGEGNIRAMLKAVASEDLAVVRLVKAGTNDR